MPEPVPAAGGALAAAQRPAAATGPDGLTQAERQQALAAAPLVAAPPQPTYLPSQATLAARSQAHDHKSYMAQQVCDRARYFAKLFAGGCRRVPVAPGDAAPRRGSLTAARHPQSQRVERQANTERLEQQKQRQREADSRAADLTASVEKAVQDGQSAAAAAVPGAARHPPTAVFSTARRERGRGRPTRSGCERSRLPGFRLGGLAWELQQHLHQLHLRRLGPVHPVRSRP